MTGRRWLPLLTAAAALGLGASLAAAPARRAPQGPRAADWTRTVAMTPQGGFRMGNPAARVKLVEYGSLTCSHCAAFAREGMKPLLAQYVRTGKVSFEYRNMVLNGIDVTAALLARCGGAATFFPMVEALYATQPQWVGRISGMSAEQKDRLKTLSESQRIARIAEAGGLTALAARGGVAPRRARQCLADPAALARLGRMYEEAVKLGVEGTPTFLVDGAKVEAGDWAALEPLIRRAAG